MDIFLGLIGVQELFHLIFPFANIFFVLRRPPPPHNFSNGPSVTLIAFPTNVGFPFLCQ